jgi:membrane-bound serine protease (ClpP class)
VALAPSAQPAWARRLLGLILAAAALLAGGQGGSGQPATGAGVVPAGRAAANVAVVTIQDAIDSTTLASVRRRMQLAERAGADAIVFELNTPGGELGAVLGICDAIKSSRIKNTVAWVHPTAYSGGAVIALACREMVTSDPGTLGDALPIAVGAFNQINALPEHERQKFLSPLIAELVDSARRNGYDELLVQGIAARGVELWLVENSQSGRRMMINRAEYRLLFGADPADVPPALASAPALEESAGPAETPRISPGSPEQILERLRKRGRGRAPGTGQVPPPDPGDPNRYIPANPSMEPLSGAVTMQQELPSARPALSSTDRGSWRVVEYVSTGAGPLVFKAEQLRRYGLAKATVNDDRELMAFFGAKRLLRLDRSWSEGLVAFLTLFPVRGVLIVLFLVALFVEMTHPGLVLPGAISALALVALLAPPMLINLASWWEIGAIVSGLLLLALEIFVIPGFGVAGILGLLLLFGGLIGTFVPSGAFFDGGTRHQADLLYGITTLVLALACVAASMYFFSKHYRSLPIMSRLILRDAGVQEDSGDPLLAAMAEPGPGLKVGMTGTAITNLRPAGQVEIGGQLHDVVADLGYVPAGAAVRVSSVTPFRVGVEQV